MFRGNVWRYFLLLQFAIGSSYLFQHAHLEVVQEPPCLLVESNNTNKKRRGGGGDRGFRLLNQRQMAPPIEALHAKHKVAVVSSALRVHLHFSSLFLYVEVGIYLR